MIEYIVKKRKIAILFFVMAVLYGGLTFFQIPQQEVPTITVSQANITTIYPGASPEKVEQTVTKVIEEEIKGISGIKDIISRSGSGVSVISVVTKEGIDPESVWQELRNEVNDAEAELPEDANQPQVNDDLGSTFIQTINLSADTREQLYSLRETIENWQEQLRTVPGVSDVILDGLPEQEIRIEVDTQKLNAYQIPWSQVMGAIQTENQKIPLGQVEIGGLIYRLDLPYAKDPQNLERVIVSKNAGFPIYLKDVAEIEQTTEEIDQLVYHNGKPSVSISVRAELNVDVPSVQRDVDEIVERLEKDLPAWVEHANVYSQKERINELFHELTREMLIAIGAVILVCSLGLNVITSLVIAVVIPICIAVGLMFLPFFDISINQISIFALIVVLGILVDDAVVVNDNIERRLSSLGESPFRAAINGAKEVSISILTATLATISAFAPLVFLKGESGQFIRPLPVIVTLTMLTSMIISLTIIPIFRYWYDERRKGRTDDYLKPPGLMGKQFAQLAEWYGKTLMPKALKKPLRTGLIGVLIGTLAYGLIPFTPVELFPTDDRAEMLIDVQLPDGSNLKQSNEVVEGISDWLLQQKGVEMVAAYAGSGAPEIFVTSIGLGEGENVGQLLVRIDRNQISTSDVVEPWKSALSEMYPEATITPKEIEAGPPVGSPIEIRLFGEDIQTLRQLARDVKETVAKVNGTYNIKDSFGRDMYTLEFDVNESVMDEKLVNYADLTKTIRLASDGMDLGEFDTGRDLIDMTIYSRESKQDIFNTFRHLTVPNAQGVQIPLTQLVDIKPNFSVQAITHRNLERAVTITADVRGVTATEAMQQITADLQNKEFPEGYRWETGGETSEQVEIFIDLGRLFVVVVFLIVIMIAMQFYSLSLPFLVMSTVYLAFAGSLIGLFITRTPLGFMTMMGLISLSGIVVRNGIVFIEFIEDARKAGADLTSAVIQAGEARLRPILLTTLTAAAGLTPLSIIGGVLFRPLALTIIFGLLFSTMLTLIVVPSFYTVMAKIKEKRKMKKTAKSIESDHPSYDI